MQIRKEWKRIISYIQLRIIGACIEKIPGDLCLYVASSYLDLSSKVYSWFPFYYSLAPTALPFISALVCLFVGSLPLVEGSQPIAAPRTFHHPLELASVKLNHSLY